MVFYITPLKECLIALSDESFQCRVWLGQSPAEQSSFAELACQTFDDTGLGDALRNPAADSILGAAAATLRELHQAIDWVDGHLPTDELIRSPAMQNVRKLALRALQELEMK